MRRAKRQTQNGRGLVRKLVIYLTAAIAGFIMLFPFVWILITSLETELDAVSLPPFPFKEITFTLSNFVYNLTVSGIPQAVTDSAIVAIGSSIMVFTISAWAAYAMSKINFRGRSIMYNSLIVLYMIPGLPMLIPIVILFRQLHVMDTLPALIIADGIILLPLMTWFLVGIFDSVPKELDEAARADGLSRFWTIMRVNMPLAKTGLALVLVFSFTISWNELMFANTIGLVNTPMLQPVILDYTIGTALEFTKVAAGGVLSSLPIIVLAFLLQRYIIAGIMKGAIK